MRLFKFLAKQNQHNDIAAILQEELKVAPSIVKVDGGFQVSCHHNTSNRRINKILFDYGIPGAVNPKNLPISKIDHPWDALEKFGKKKFVQSYRPHGSKKSKLRKVQVVKIEPRCDCCSPYFQIQSCN